MNASTYQLTIKTYDKLGTLERILRVIRHRGGVIEAMQMQKMADDCLFMTFTLKTTRSITNLLSQLAKLIDVISVNH